MNSVVLGVLAAAGYIAGTVAQTRNAAIARVGTTTRIRVSRSVALLGGLAVVLHALCLLGLIVTPAGYYLGVFAVGSLVALVAVAMVLLSTLSLPVGNLLIVLFPIAILGIASSLLVQGDYPPGPLPAPGHIVLSLLAYSVLFIAACQALALAFQERRLRSTRSLRALQLMPPLQVMENLLFQMLWVGLALLSLSIVTGLLFLENMFAQRVVQHAVLSMSSWVVFAILLWGRHTLGWRGRTAIRWTLAGFVILAIAYFGSKFVIEFLLTP